MKPPPFQLEPRQALHDRDLRLEVQPVLDRPADPRQQLPARVRIVVREPGPGRLDFDLTVTPETDSLSGTATLYLVPLADDPLAEDKLKNGRTFAITGQRLKVR